MATPKRKISPLGIYHITVRGINKQDIFENAADFEKYLEILHKYETICDFKLLGYCLMSNHVHLVIKVGKMPLGRIFQHISPSYVYYYNQKYARVGSLFQSPFKSRPINSESQLLTVIRYVHQNPVKAGICKKPKDYKYSSYPNYYANQLIDASFVQSFVSRKDFFSFNCAPNNDHCLDIDDEKPRLNDERAKEIMYNISGCSNVTQFQALEKDKRDRALREMWKAGISMNRANRMTGISYGIIRKAVKF
ncbi:MAG: transposase [Lachnospiraceae bacterium]|nr:transposase [Lachnospiraceae bacterium]